MFSLRRGRDTGPSWHLFFATDIHGSNVCFRKFLNAGTFYGAEILILGGDVTGKMVVPIIRVDHGSRWHSTFSGTDVWLDTEAEVQSFIIRLGDMGFYPMVMTRDEFDLAAADPAHQERLFRGLIVERLQQWLEWADSKLAAQGGRIYVAPGNDDGFCVDPLLERSTVLQNLEGRRIMLVDGVEMITTGVSNPTPWKTEREMAEDALYDHLHGLVAQVENTARCIFNIHVPPYNAVIDECPALDENLRPLSAMGNPVMKPAGSTSVRRIIEEYRPFLTLHGHIHEGRGSIKIGPTLCVNPGSAYSEGTLQGCVLTIRNGQVRDVQFTTG